MAESRLEELTRWRVEAAEEVRLLRAELAVLQKRAEDAQVRLGLVERLLALEGNAGDGSLVSHAASPDLLDACEEILRAKGHPMHISEVYSELVGEAVPIPGKGNEANVIARLQRSDGRIIRTGRGIYSLPEFGIAEQKPTKQRKRARRK